MWQHRGSRRQHAPAKAAATAAAQEHSDDNQADADHDNLDDSWLLKACQHGVTKAHAAHFPACSVIGKVVADGGETGGQRRDSLGLAVCTGDKGFGSRIGGKRRRLCRGRRRSRRQMGDGNGCRGGRGGRKTQQYCRNGWRYR